MNIRPVTEVDREWISHVLKTLWGSTRMVMRGKLTELSGLEAFIAEEEGRKVGLITYQITHHPEHSEGSECEIASINALTPGKGIGTALLEKVEEEAKGKRCRKLVVITTNDNPKAIAFYEKKGFSVTDVRKNVMEEYRKLKPEIPLFGNDGIPLTDEIELEKSL